jgi:carboxymethylenebutenolidase
MVHSTMTAALSLFLGCSVCGLAFAAEPTGRSDAAQQAAQMAQEHQHDAPTPSPATEPEPREPVVTMDNVPYGTAGGQALHGYIAHPKGRGPSGIPALIVIHEWWGLNDNIKAVTRRLAGEGYTALAVDLYGGTHATTPDEAQKLMAGALGQMDVTAANLRAAYDDLKQAGATRVGVIGWCFGGGWSLQTALAIPDGIAAAVVYYGRPESDRAKLGALRAPVLGLYGADDKSIPVEAVHGFETLAHELGKQVNVHIYPGAGHAFANPSGNNYRPEAAADAWKRTIAFFAANLKS